MDGLLRQIGDLPFVKDDPTANRIMESFATCETMESLVERIDLLIDHVQSLFRSKLIAEGGDPAALPRAPRKRGVLQQDGRAAEEDPATPASRTVLKL